jgi:hypothetical protein
MPQSSGLADLAAELALLTCLGVRSVAGRPWHHRHSLVFAGATGGTLAENQEEFAKKATAHPLMLPQRNIGDNLLGFQPCEKLSFSVARIGN